MFTIFLNLRVDFNLINTPKRVTNVVLAMRHLAGSPHKFHLNVTGANKVMVSFLAARNFMPPIGHEIEERLNVLHGVLSS